MHNWFKIKNLCECLPTLYINHRLEYYNPQYQKLYIYANIGAMSDIALSVCIIDKNFYDD